MRKSHAVGHVAHAGEQLPDRDKSMNGHIDCTFLIQFLHVEMPTGFPHDVDYHQLRNMYADEPGNNKNDEAAACKQPA